jgi:VanZ family protein
MALMVFGSTDLMSAEHTSRFITPFLRWLKPDISPVAIAHVHMVARKTAHLAEYAILTSLLFRALPERVHGFWRRAGMAFVPAMIFAVADEYHQSFIPSRTASPIDVLVDCCGAFLGILSCRAIYPARARREAMARKSSTN